jgi:asparagine synthase (glutamine-hydrolysing)
MCGIAGCVVRSPDVVRRDWLSTMAASLRHRGPDDRGFLQWSAGEPAVGRDPDLPPGQVGLVHQRLSILDLSENGWQPMRGHDGRQHIVYNGEIYNYIELRDELRRLGHEFTSTGDTEVLLAAFSQWGEAALSRLVGMYALALVDTRSRTLTLARDPFGIKPLYYATWPGGMAFASEIKALLELPAVSRRASPRALHDYLRSGAVATDDQTFFADVREIPAGHSATLSLDSPDRVAPVRFWAPPAKRDLELSFGDAAEQLRSMFLDSIRLHLRSDVPIGTALSGGIDSSAIVAAVRAVGGDDVDIRTFSYIADDPALTEERWIDLQVDASSAKAEKVSPPVGDLVRDLDRLIKVQDEPFGSTSIYAQFRVFEMAAEAGVKVMLDGQGADEMLAGYQPYVSARVASLLRRGRPDVALRLARGASRNPGGARVATIAGKGAMSLLPAVAARAARTRFGSGNGAELWLDSEWFAARGCRAAEPQRDAGLSGALLRDFGRDSLPGLLRYEDRNSMAFSIESRVPFLTPRLADFVFRLPESHLLGGDATSKAVFRAAMRGLVPDRILDRRDKIGFATPEKKWLQALRPWIGDVLGQADDDSVPMLRMPAVRRELDAVLDGRAAFGWHVWRWINLIRWSELYSVDVTSAG